MKLRGAVDEGIRNELRDDLIALLTEGDWTDSKTFTGWVMVGATELYYAGQSGDAEGDFEVLLFTEDPHKSDDEISAVAGYRLKASFKPIDMRREET